MKTHTNNELDRLNRRVYFWMVIFLTPCAIGLWCLALYLCVELWKAWP